MQAIDSKIMALVGNYIICRRADMASCPDIALWDACMRAVADGFVITARQLRVAAPGWEKKRRFRNLIFATHPDKGHFFIGQWPSFQTEQYGDETHGCSVADRHDLPLMLEELRKNARPSYAEHLRSGPTMAWGLLIFLMCATASAIAVGMLARTALYIIVPLACLTLLLTAKLPRRIVDGRFVHYWARDETAQLIDQMEIDGIGTVRI